MTDERSGICACGCGQPTKLARNTTKTSTRGEVLAFVHGHNGRVARPYVEQDRGYETPCWIWQQSKDRGGYGKTSRAGRSVPAHRVYYEGRFGDVPQGMFLDHLCRVRCCVNPEHLEPVTNRENLRRGEGTKLDRNTVLAVRWSGQRAAWLARHLGVDPATIGAIRAYRSWKDIAA